jgi:hypothetical protein
VKNSSEHDIDAVIERLPLASGFTQGRHDPGVSDNEVEAPQLAQAFAEYRVDGVEVTNISLAGHDVPAGLLDQAHCLVQVFRRGERVGNGLD